jgi:hypothetical protein
MDLVWEIPFCAAVSYKIMWKDIEKVYGKTIPP